jgi:hypothetical protein
MRILRVILFLLLFLSIPLLGQTATKLTSYWTAGSCSTGCITSYTLSITPPSGTVIIIPLAPTVTSYVWAPGGKLPWGPYIIAITTNVSAGTTPVPSTVNIIYASGVSTGTAPGGFQIRYTK